PATPGLPNALCSLGTVSWQRPNIGSRVTREGHARFWERPGVEFLRVTGQSLPIDLARTTSAHPPTAEVSLRCGKCRNGPMRDIRFSLDDLVGYSITLSARAS